jgi:hypothetical protein
MKVKDEVRYRTVVHCCHYLRSLRKVALLCLRDHENLNQNKTRLHPPCRPTLFALTMVHVYDTATIDVDYYDKLLSEADKKHFTAEYAEKGRKAFKKAKGPYEPELGLTGRSACPTGSVCVSL